jgi:thiamine-phosphate pyrophosphorylase
MPNAYLRLCLVTHQDTHSFNFYKNFILRALAGGITAIQLREKNKSRLELKKLAVELKILTSQFNVPLIINDDVDLAKEVDADGVHLGQGDESPEAARKTLGPNKIIGVSVETLSDLLLANQSHHINYIAASAVFPSKSKTNCKTYWSLSGLRKISTLSVHPVIAIGGVDNRNVIDVMQAGASGIAVISVMHESLNPEITARALIMKIDKVIAEKITC